MTDKQVIREAFFALCDYQSPSHTKEQKEMALVRCWQILAVAVRAKDDDESR